VTGEWAKGQRQSWQFFMAKPIRTCIGCGKKIEKGNLIRFVRNPDFSVSLDPNYKKPGRGGYVCPNEGCIKNGIIAKRVNWVLRTDLNDKDIEQLKQELLNVLGLIIVD